MKFILDKFSVYLHFKKGLSPSSTKSHLSDISLFFHFLKHKNRQKLSNITEQNIQSYLRYLFKKNYTQNSIDRKISSLKTFFTFLKNSQIIHTNPTSTISTPQKVHQLPSVLSLEEVELLINTPNKSQEVLFARNTAIIEIMYSCGLRVSELTSLLSNHICYKTKTIKVVGKGQKERIIPFGEVAKKKLLLYIKEIRPKLNKNNLSYFFLNNKGKQITRQQIWYIIKKRLLSCSINKKVSPHTLRHSFATHLLDNGTSIAIIQKLLGHQNINTTEIYTHISTKKLQEIHKKYHNRS